MEDLERAIPGFQRSTGAEWDGRVWDDPLQRVRVAFLRVAGSPVQMELVAPLTAPLIEDSPVKQFLERGGGLHHLCYEVAELDECLAAMRAAGNLMLHAPVPAIAFENRRIAWVMTREKLLVELVEAASGEVSCGDVGSGDAAAALC